MLRLTEGPNELEVFAEGYVTARQPITVVPGATLSVVVALAAEPSAPPPPHPAPEPAPAPPPPPPLVCPGAQVATPQTLGHCCWPGQIYSTVAQACTGFPQCPSGMVARGETCDEAPPPPPPVVLQRPDPEVPAPSTAPGQFMLAVSGGVNMNQSSDGASFTSQARIGFVLGGHFVLGLVGWYYPASLASVGGGSLQLGGEFGGDVVRVQIGVHTGLYLAARGVDPTGEPPLLLNVMPEVALLVFPTRAFYFGIELQTRFDLTSLNSNGMLKHDPYPIGLLELGIRL